MRRLSSLLVVLATLYLSSASPADAAQVHCKTANESRVTELSGFTRTKKIGPINTSQAEVIIANNRVDLLPNQVYADPKEFKKGNADYLLSGVLFNCKQNSTDAGVVVEGKCLFNAGSKISDIAPASDNEEVIKTRFGREYKGKIVSVSRDKFVFLTSQGKQHNLPVQDVIAVSSPRVYNFVMKLSQISKYDAGVIGETNQISFFN